MANVSTPHQDGFRMPAEWERHLGTWLAWPHSQGTWFERLQAIPPIWIEMIRALQEGEKVYLLVNDPKMEQEARQKLVEANVPLQNVRFFQIPTVDAWLRDTGPIFVVKEEAGQKRLALVDWIFNAWGRKYPEWEQDNSLPEKIAEQLELPLYRPGIVLEGGSIDGNGQGTFLTTEQCLLNPNRNPALSRGD